MEQNLKILKEKNEILEKNIGKKNEDEINIKQILKEKNKALRDGEENNNLLRKDLDIINGKLKDVIKENENIKKINKDLFNEKNRLEKELNELKKNYENLVIDKTKIENENKLIKADFENIKYKNTVNEKKIYVNNCEIQEMDKTIKYLKKNLEQNKMMNNNNYNTLNKTCKIQCYKCGCEKNTNYNTFMNGKEYDIQKLIEDNKALYQTNKDLKNQLNNMAVNLNLYINENSLAANRINKLENYIKNK